MKKITLILNDDGLLEDLANAAERDGVALEDVVIDAIYYWDAETNTHSRRRSGYRRRT